MVSPSWGLGLGALMVLACLDSASSFSMPHSTVAPTMARINRDVRTRTGLCSLRGSGGEKETEQESAKDFGRRGLLAGLGASVLGTMMPSAAQAGAPTRTIAEIPASGFFFKDIVKVTALEDPKVKGVSLYISEFERPLTERVQKNFFSDPTQASVACAKTGKITLAEDINKSKEGEEVFEQARSLLFKTVRVRRIYDEESKTLVYVSYSTRFNKDDDENQSKYKTTTCAIPIGE